jgi:putative endonuclease
MYTVYALKSLVKNYIYVGFTNNIEKRLYYHNSGYNKSTNPYRPFKLIYSEEVTNSTDARIREKFLKSGQGRKFLKTIMHYE